MGAFVLIDRKTDATAAAGMIVSAVEAGLESATDRVVRLVRAAIPARARLDLPDDDEAAVKQLRELFKKDYCAMNDVETENRLDQNQGLDQKIQEAEGLIAAELAKSGAHCVTSSFQTECVVLVHMLTRQRPDIPVLFLETGYHFPEALAYPRRDLLIGN